MERGEMPEEERQSGRVLPTSLESENLKKSNWGFLLTGIIGGALVTVYAVATPFITPALRKVCLPFVPATSKQIENVVKMLQHRRGSLVDIGSGDGRIVIAAAKEGFPAVGYELNPWLVWYSRYRAWREGVHGSAKFYISDLWKVTFAQYSNVVIFGVPQMFFILSVHGLSCASPKELEPSILIDLRPALHEAYLVNGCSSSVKLFSVPLKCHSWRRNLSLNLRTMLELLPADSLSHTGLQTTLLERALTLCGHMT
ncbi:ATP synthase subunit C lysine N-methyltransferase isoform X2 [Psammomys obesus]|uniref:ATP synthase subunit C lysine N-methyltransferase isoform X2 n=1 Tax=Psammomys obesus TaxID=48139 RepID=UPI00245370BD|nr:ATP synthase subunit C lysine N-methyltransferase isoform X2 [Psammomys obesus]